MLLRRLLRVLLRLTRRLVKLLLRSRVDHLDLLRSQLGHLAKADGLHRLRLHRLHLLDWWLAEAGCGGVICWLYTSSGCSSTKHWHSIGIA